jgi:hypothetical protein
MSSIGLADMKIGEERDLDQLAFQGAGVDPSECNPAGVCKVIPSDADRLPPMKRRQVTGA